MSMFDLTGKTVLITGGSGVLGQAMGQALLTCGARVLLGGRDPERMETAVATLAHYGDVRGATLDVTSRASIGAWVDVARSWASRVDVLVNAAGVNQKKPFFEIDDDDWERIMAVNAQGTFVTSQIVARLMLEQGGGSIINLSSVSSDPPLSGVFAYSASKAAVNSMTQYLARELAPTIRVNALIPGFFPAEQNRAILTPARIAAITDHTPLGRLGEPPELGGAVVWLASEAASGFVTGALIRVDGGFGAMTI